MKILSETTLNSIMFLLIPKNADDLRKDAESPLNSIMFLLIRDWWNVPVPLDIDFKFHYVSINSKEGVS